jgi:hypothetical protein
MGNLQGRFEHIIKETHASLIQQFTSSSNLLTQGQHRRANGQQPSGHFNWGDGLIHHAVPIGWSFPNRITPKALWDLWYFGNQAENIGPYRYISVEHDLPIKKDKCQYSRAKKVMEYLGSLIVPSQLPQGKDRISQLSPAESDSVFSEVFKQSLRELYGEERKCRRNDDVTVGRIYNLICDKNKQQQ